MQYMNMNNGVREKGQLSVNGIGIIKVNADLAILKVGVTTSNEDIQVAQINNTNTVNTLIQSLTEYKIPEENINAYDIFIKKIYDSSNNQIIGYEITTTIRIEITDISNLGDIYSLAIENGANSEIDISFTLSNINHYYKKALIKATQDALNKGSLLSKNLNIRLNPLPKSIYENSVSQYSISEKNVAYSSSPLLSSGDLEVTAQVSMIFDTYL